MNVYSWEVGKMDNNMIIAYNLKRIRFQKNWSQAFVARQLGVSVRTISRAETLGKLSDKLLRRICSLYQIQLINVFKEIPGDEEEKHIAEVVPTDVIFKILQQSDFVTRLEQETLVRYNDEIQRNAIMYREDIEQIIPDVISNKKSYTLSDIISCCMAVNQRTVENIRFMTAG